MGTLYRSEPSEPMKVWRPSFDLLTQELERARKFRNVARLAVTALVAVVAIAFLFLYAPPPSPAEVQQQAKLTPLMTAGGWIPNELQPFFFAITFGVLAVEYALSRTFPVLANEDAIITLLRYYGSTVQNEKPSL